MSDPMEERLRKMLRVEAANLSIEPQPWTEGVDVVAAPAQRRLSVWWAAAAVAMLGVAGGVVAVAANRDRDGDVQRIVPVVPPTTELMPATSGAPASTTPEAVESNAVGWFVPSSIPEGFEVSQASATRWVMTAAPGFWFGSWIDTSGGSLNRRLAWSSFPSIDDFSPATLPDAQVVRGVLASVSEGDDGYVTVRWAEGGRDHAIVSSLDAATVVALAETATIDTDGTVVLDSSVVAPGLRYVEPVATDPTAEELGVSTWLTFVSGEAADARSLTLTIGPNDMGASLDSYTSPGVVERIVIDGVEREIAIRDSDGRQVTEVRWFADGFQLTVSGVDVGRDVVEEFAAGVAPADETTFLSFETDLTDRALELPVFSRATFEDGLTVTVRGSDPTAFASPGVDAPPAYVCVEAVTVHCSNGGRGGSGSMGPNGEMDWTVIISQTFEIDGRKTLVHWSSKPLDQLRVTAGNAYRGAPPRADPLPFTHLDGTVGAFVRVDVESDLELVNIGYTGGSSGANVSPEIYDTAIRTR